MRWAMRILGGLNVVVCFFSLLYFAWGIQIHLGNWPGNPNYEEWAVFLVISAVSTFLVLYLAYLGLRLIGGDRQGTLESVLRFFISEMAIWFLAL